MSGFMIGPCGVAPAVVAGGSFASFDPAFSNGSQSLSNGNLTITYVSGVGSSRTLTSHTSGKYYFEFTAGATSANTYVGFMDPAFTNSASLGSTTDAFDVDFTVPVWANSFTITTAPALVSGHVYGMAIDMGAKLAWVIDITAAGNWNANGTANPATGVNGTDYSPNPVGISNTLYVGCTVFNGGVTVTFNFGATAYTGTAPSSFGNW